MCDYSTTVTAVLECIESTSSHCALIPVECIHHLNTMTVPTYWSGYIIMTTSLNRLAIVDLS